MDYWAIETPIGWAELHGDTNGLSVIKIVDEQPEVSGSIPEALIEVSIQLKDYFNNNRTSFDLSINPDGTSFEKRVWQELSKIPFGKTLSYLELSKKLGNSKAIRAVARANGKNPLWVVIPCHRVIGSDGSLTGYAGGLHRKEWLLRHEGAIKQQSLF
ncbi:methylated-DNA--[protein]-cysteine S-methyltransferase [Winogradskyella aurantiaca]|uniref:methylated-DNA--[protein]-cysteine S-methyltransferase n=1 Tax=Winogradskyella aurantiaca TaxID=2219558 RepID=UPI000E1E2876|nr:methylated-DNA--[protein]-cysteine S-methyltransferase [Winogradskyella aurantiaca]